MNNQTAKKVFGRIFDEDIEPISYIEENGLKSVTDTGMLERVVEKVLAQNPKTAEEYQSGKTKVLWFFGGAGYERDERKGRPPGSESAAHRKIAVTFVLDVSKTIKLYKFFLIDYTVSKTIPGTEYVCRGFLNGQHGCCRHYGLVF